MASPPAAATRRGAGRGQIAASAGYAVLLAALLALRLHSASAMWLDEALSVNIARLPVPDLLAALRQDGSPPLYYLLLHGWIGLFGTGTDAVRAFSSTCSVLAVPIAFLAGRRLHGPRAGAAAALLLAACPFAIRYATEARMYALVMLLSLVGVLAVLRALARPTPARLVAVAVVCGLLALTHYWTLFLLLVGELGLLGHALRQPRRGPAARVALALPCGALLFLPWLPSFRYQTLHTGTPWAPVPTWWDAVHTVRLWAGPGSFGAVLTGLLVALALAGLRQRAGGQLLLLGMGSLVLGLLASRVQGAGYALRYSAPDVVPVLLAAGLGAAGLAAGGLGRRFGALALGGAALLGLAVALFSPLLGERTQAAATAALLRAQLKPGDLVVYCPDQLGPAVDRLLPRGVAEVVYPTLGPPQRIDWVDYAARNESASPSAVAATLNARARGAVWLVRADGYRTFGTQCASLDRDLAALRGGRNVVQQPAHRGEVEWLVGYPAPSS